LGTPRVHPPTQRFVAIFSRHAQGLSWARERIAAQWGEIWLASEEFEVTETAYYARLMGSGLRKQLLACAGDYDPALLADSKLTANQWEQAYAATSDAPEPRPVNIDPGYVTPMKVVLASTKDRAHRIYLRDGIFAEESLFYRDHAWQARPWTYPDYLRREYHEFFDAVRARLRVRLAELEQAARAAGENSTT
jgi:hypothetical protein